MKAIEPQHQSTQILEWAYHKDLQELGVDPKDARIDAKKLGGAAKLKGMLDKDGRLTAEGAQALVRAKRAVGGPKLEPAAIEQANQAVRATTMAVAGMAGQLSALAKRPLGSSDLARLSSRGTAVHRAITLLRMDTLTTADVKVRGELSAALRKLNDSSTAFAKKLSFERESWLDSPRHDRNVIPQLTASAEALAPLSKLANGLAEPAWGTIEAGHLAMLYPNFQGTGYQLERLTGLPPSAVIAAMSHNAGATPQPMEQALDSLRYLNALEQSRPSAPLPMPWPYLASSFGYGFNPLASAGPMMPWWMTQRFW